MKLEPQVVLRDVPHSDAVEANIRRHAEKLELMCDHIMSCRVTVETPGKHKHQGKLYSVHVDLKVPEEEIASTRHHESEDVYVAIRDAFDAVKRRLEDYVRRERGQTKPHKPLVRGHVVRLFDDGHGFIEDAEGSQYYFDRANLVQPDFDQLEIGTAVEFLADMASQGLQAKRVSRVGHPATGRTM